MIDFLYKIQMDISELDQLEDKRPAPFWKMSWLEVIVRAVFVSVVIYIHAVGYTNPNDTDNFFFKDFKISNITGIDSK